MLVFFENIDDLDINNQLLKVANQPTPSLFSNASTKINSFYLIKFEEAFLNFRIF